VRSWLPGQRDDGEVEGAKKGGVYRRGGGVCEGGGGWVGIRCVGRIGVRRGLGVSESGWGGGDKKRAVEDGRPRGFRGGRIL